MRYETRRLGGMLGTFTFIALASLAGTHALAPHYPESTRTVEHVHDGDTARLRCPSGVERVRLYCIDASELDQEPWGGQARALLSRFEGSEVRLVDRGRNRYGRIIGKVIADGSNLSVLLVKAGAAVVYRRHCLVSEFLGLERLARAAKVGIRSVPGDHQAPWAYRARRREARRE
jgi:micrococcal nuclease